MLTAFTDLALADIELLLFDTPALFWLVAGLLLLGLEMLIAGSFFLSFALSAFIIALSTFVITLDHGFLWRLAAFAIIGVVLISPLRKALRKRVADKKDINEY